MAYEEQSSSDQYGDLDRLLARYPAKDLVSQIPGQTAAGARTEAPKSLREKAASALTQANPLMMRKSMEDMARTLVGGAALPVVAPVSAGIQALNALPGNLLRRSRGEEEIATPSTEELMRKYGEFIAPKTQMGRDFEAGLGKAMDVAKVPHAWSMSPPAPRRPMLTPTDVRVGAGQIKQLAKELRETPADFQAAQSGLKRQNLYGEDTIGVKAQAAADALGDTIERRQASGKSVIPGVPQALTPDTKMYAVRPKGTRMIQPKMPESAKGFSPDINQVNELVSDIYGDTPAAEMPQAMVAQEYSKRYLDSRQNADAALAFKEFENQKVGEMFPDAPTVRDARNAFNLLFNDREVMSQKQLEFFNEFLQTPEGQVLRQERGIPTPAEFMERMGEAERVFKGPFTNYIAKNVGAEGDPTVKLAREGLTMIPEEQIRELADFVPPDQMAKKRTQEGFPALGSFYEERMSKAFELGEINTEIDRLEAIRRPLFDLAHEQGIDPASLPEYSETTNPLRQKLREKEKIQEDLNNIDLASKVEDIGDASIYTRKTKEMLEEIPYEQRQFFPSVTKAGPEEKHYKVNATMLKEMGFKDIGKELLEDILNGKAGDTSKLTIENYIRQKGLSRKEAEKAAKLQEQKYRETLQNTLLERIRSDQNVQTFGNAAIITLDQNTPKDVAMRDMSADTAVLDHCVGQCGTAPQGRKNILSGKQQYYEPVIDPITGERSSRASGDTSYVRDLEQGNELVSVRDAKTGLPAATIQLMRYSDDLFRIGYASGAKNGAVDPAYVGAIKDYLNSRASLIKDTGGNLSDNTGIFDSTSPAEFKRAAREAGLTEKQVKATDWYDLPRFVTVDDVKAAAKGVTGTEVAVVEPQRQAVAQQGQPVPIPEDLDATTLLAGYADRLSPEQTRWLQNWMDQYDRSAEGSRQEQRLIDVYYEWQAGNTLAPDPLANLFDDLEPDDTAAANNPMLQYSPQTRELALRYDIPPVTVAEIQAEFLDRRMTMQFLNNMAGNALRGQRGTIFENLPEASRLGAEQMIRDEIGRRAARANQAEVGEQAPQAFAAGPLANELYDMDVEQGVANVQSIENTIYALRNGVIDHQAFRELPENRRQDAMDLVADMVQARLTEQAAVEPPAPAQRAEVPMMRAAPIPRHIQTLGVQDLIQNLSPEWNRQAQELADTYFNDNVIDGNNVTIGALTNMLRNYRVGPHADSPNEVRELAARRLERQHTEAMESAEQLADSLNEAFYADMDPQEAVDQITRDINMLRRNGENSWEDLVGPMAEDVPWNANLQHNLIGYLEELANRYGDMREEGYAKGGMVKKKHMAKKDGMPLILTRKSPELTELAYQYGGMVG